MCKTKQLETRIDVVCVCEFVLKQSILSYLIMGDPLHNLTEFHTTWQHTTELHTTLQFGDVLARLCAIYPDNNVGWPDVGPTSPLSSRRWSMLTQSAELSDWLSRGLPIRVTHTTELAHHSASGLYAARRCAVRLCAIRLGCVESHPRFMQYTITFGLNTMAYKIVFCAS